NGIYGQKFSSSGNRLWGSSGKVFVPLSAPNTKSISDLSSHMGTEKVYLFYLESDGSGLNTKTLGFACDTSGAFIWPGNFVTLSNPTQEKLQMETAMDVNKNCKLVWGDRRLDSQGIYAQDINPLGQLGQPIIPVELTSFTAIVIGKNVNLNWSTATETNNKGFEVEKLRNDLIGLSNDWEKIGIVDGNGTTTEPISYSFVDANVISGAYQYRLKQIDYDGTFEYSNTIVVEIILPAEFALYQNYPNPFNPSTVIEFSLPEDVGNVKLSIYNALGEKVAELVNTSLMAGRYQYQWNAQNIATGMYNYELRTDNFVSVKKMVLIR
ncbi:MAG TPA: T9SS type A sorting domain-containing protein, partial [Ignavibacteriaceae bacterium]